MLKSTSRYIGNLGAGDSVFQQDIADDSRVAKEFEFANQNQQDRIKKAIKEAEKKDKKKEKKKKKKQKSESNTKQKMRQEALKKIKKLGKNNDILPSISPNQQVVDE